MSNYIKHIKTINKHRWVVFKWCCKLGIPFRGLVHDLSKYSPKELSICTFYIGNKSPHDEARKILGYSPSWLYHRNRNKHHWEYWIDSFEKMNPVKIPYKYVLEMVADFVGAGQAYEKDKWDCKKPLEYHLKFKSKKIMHLRTLTMFETILKKLAELDVKEFHKWFKSNKKQMKKEYNK